MKYIALISFFFSSFAFAEAQNFHCKATYNNETFVDQKVSLGSSSLNFGGAEAFNFHLLKKDNARIELQASNMEEPSRSYATATMKNAGDNVELSIWTKYYLMEVRCTLL